MLESVRARLALWHTATLGVLLSAFALAAYLYTETSTLHRTDEYLRESAGAFAGVLADEREELPSARAAAAEVVRDIRFGSLDFSVYDAALRPLAASEQAGMRPGRPAPRHAAALLRQLQRRRGSTESLFTLPDAEGGFRVYARTVRLGGERITVAVEQPLYARQEALEEARTVLLVSLPLVLLLAWAGGYLLARRSLAPVVAMSEQAALLGAANLDQPLEVDNPRDELGRLALVFNELLGRLSRAMQQQRQFMADASHELRTPVSIVRGEADIALSEPSRSEAEYREALGVVRGEARRLSRIVDDLFLLTRADAGQQPLQPVELYLDEVAGECVRSLRSLAAQREIRLECEAEGELPYRGDEPLLHRLLLNLLENAVKYSAPGSSVRVVAERAAGGYRLRVHDTAPPIPPDAAPHIFERFYRVGRTRARRDPDSSGGAGLGLSIARWVAEAHGGSLRLAQSTAEGNVFELLLPVP